MEDLIRKLSEAYGPSGLEDDVRALIRQEIEGHVDEIRVDAMGNLIARKKMGGEGALKVPKIMVAAHMDEIGLIVTHVDDKGFLRVAQVGWVPPICVAGSSFAFRDGTVAAAGLERKGATDKIPGMEKFFLDVGATDKASCPVQVGDIAVYRLPFYARSKAAGARWIGKSMDDRVGCAVLIEAIRTLKAGACDLYAVFTVQEEVGARGAVTGAFGVDPDIGLALDVTATGDVPESLPMAVSLGAGPAIKIKDSGMIAHRQVREWMIELALALSLPHQLEVLVGGATDAMSIQLSREGVPTGCLSIPTRYVHSPAQMVDAGDVLASVKLLVAFLENPPSIEGES